MLKATQIKDLIPAGGSLTMKFIATKEGGLTVVIDPKLPSEKLNQLSDAEKEINKAMAPRIITGTLEELDNNFPEYLRVVIEKKVSLSSALADIDKETEEAIKAAKRSSEKKIESTKKTTKPAPKPAGKNHALSSNNDKGTESTDEANEKDSTADQVAKKVEVKEGQSFSLF